MTSDWQYLERARRGDEAAWRVLLERHQPRLKALAYLVSGCAASAKDIVQTAFTRLVQTELHHRNGTVSGLLATIVYRLALKERSRQERLRNLDDHDFADDRPSPLVGLIKEERDRQIAAAIRSLSPEHRDILVLRFYGGHSYEEIAKLMMVPIGTVKSRMFYAVKACQKILLDKGVLE
jgi:RNA polymerase sigma-70 factor, ECF subfamily